MGREELFRFHGRIVSVLPDYRTERIKRSILSILSLQERMSYGTHPTNLPEKDTGSEIMEKITLNFTVGE